MLEFARKQILSKIHKLCLTDVDSLTENNLDGCRQKDPCSLPEKEVRAKLIQKAQWLYKENRPSNYTKLGNYGNYCKVKSINVINKRDEELRKSAVKSETKRLLKKIPESILQNFHIPNYLRG